MLGRNCVVLTLVVAAGLPGCNDDDGGPAIPDCIDIDTTCDHLYEPTFDNVFSMTLQPTCGVAGGSCHGAPDAEGAVRGLVMTDIDEAHALLVDSTREPRPFVEAGDASCSLLAIRISTDDDDIRMPPGSTPLDPEVRCSIVEWIENGAAR